MAGRTARWCVVMAMVTLAHSSPVSYRAGDSLAAAELGQRLAARSLLQEPRAEPRLPLPTAQDLENIKKVAQILVMLGEQRSDRDRKNFEMFADIVDAMTRTASRPPLHRSRIPQKVIPSILGDTTPAHTKPAPPPPAAPSAAEEIPNDPVQAK